jgi:hypothetical protein
MTCKILYIVHLGLVDFPAFHEEWTMEEILNKISYAASGTIYRMIVRQVHGFR